jgi:hypothetical protein
MPWRFSTLPPGLAALQAAGRVSLEPLLKRWRWRFDLAIERAQKLLGTEISLDQAAAALTPEVEAALAHIEAQAPDDNIFGVIYEQTLGVPPLLPAPALIAQAGIAYRDAEIDGARADRETDSELAAGFRQSAVEALYIVLRELNPNHLLAAARLVEYLDKSGKSLTALAEWCDLYCRTLSFRVLTQREQGRSGVLSGARAAYDDSFLGGLLQHLATVAPRLQATALLRLSVKGRPAPAIPVDGLMSLVDDELGWIKMVYQSDSGPGYFQFTPNRLHQLRTLIANLYETVFVAGFPPYPPPVRALLSRCAATMELVLKLSHDSAIRQAACEVLSGLHSSDAIGVLSKFKADSDLAVRDLVNLALERLAHHRQTA